MMFDASGRSYALKDASLANTLHTPFWRDRSISFTAPVLISAIVDESFLELRSSRGSRLGSIISSSREASLAPRSHQEIGNITCQL